MVSSRSTQRNENFNQIVSIKYPKDKYYGGAESMSYCVSTAVCLTNEGNSYVSDVMKVAELRRRRTGSYKLHCRLLKDMTGVTETVHDLREREPLIRVDVVSKTLILKKSAKCHLPQQHNALVQNAHCHRQR